MVCAALLNVRLMIEHQILSTSMFRHVQIPRVSDISVAIDLIVQLIN